MPVALITGGSRGFGRALAIDLAMDGWDLIIDGRDQSVLHHTADHLIGLGAQTVAVAGDVVDPAHRSALVEAALEFGSLDLLVNNASTIGPSPMPDVAVYPMDELRLVYETNVFAPMSLVQGALPLLRRSGGTIVALSSDAAVEPYEGWGGYGSSKAALDQLHRILAVEEPLVNVYQFDPGDMRTEMHQAAFPGQDISDRPEPESAVGSFRLLLQPVVPSGRYRNDELVLQS